VSDSGKLYFAEAWTNFREIETKFVFTHVAFAKATQAALAGSGKSTLDTFYESDCNS
jgi:hypothetical protein